MAHCIDHHVGAAVLCAGLAVGLAYQTTAATPEDVPLDRHATVNLKGSGIAVKAYEHGGRLSRLYGRPMSHGDTAEQSAEAFLDAQIDLLSVRRDDLEFDDRGGYGHIQPVMYLPETDSYKFTAVYYQQHRDGVPVYGGRLILLTRNEAGFPLVLANTDVRDIGNFQPQADGLGNLDAREARGRGEPGF